MKAFRAAAASAAMMMLNGAASTYAADLNTKAPVLKAVAEPATCTSILDFFATACLVEAYGIRFYGTVDLGYGYQSNGARFDKYSGSGVSYNPGKQNNGVRWGLAPNALSQSHVGFQIKEPLAAGWSFVGQVESAFSPMSLTLVSGIKTLHENLGVPLALQTSNADSSAQGTFYNSLGYFGFSNDTWGTLTFMRQGTLMRDVNGSYDPLAGAQAFSLIGGSGSINGGGGTEQVRQTTSVKYRVNYLNYRFGVFGQFGGYDLGNSARGVIEGQLGADFNVGPGVFSADAVVGYSKDAVGESLGGGNTVIAATGLGNPTGVPTTITATISNNTNVLAVAKYKIDRLTLYAGYEWMQYAPPSDVPTSFTDIAGYLITGLPGSGTAISTTNFNAKNKILQVVWAGGRYSITDSLDVAAGYYHYDQNQYATGTNLTNCLTKVSTISNTCAGTQDTASILFDWKFAPKWDTYIGTGYSQLNGGLDNGFLAKGFWTTVAGVRFRW
jgi:predicted porin